MHRLALLTSLAVLSFAQLNAVGTTYSWKLTGGGTWESSASWNVVSGPGTTYPDAQDDVAILGSNSGSSPFIIDLSSGPPHEDMGILHFQATGSAGHYQIDSTIDDNNLEFNASNGLPQIIVDSGANNPVMYVGPRLMPGTTLLTIDVAAGETLTSLGGIDGSPAPAAGIQWTGAGTFALKANTGNAQGPSYVKNGLVQFGCGGTTSGGCPGCHAYGGTEFTISGGTLQHIAPTIPPSNPGSNGNNQFLSTCNMTISGGTWDLGSFTESINSLTFTSGSFVGATSNLTLNAAGTALTMRDTSLSTNLTLAGGAAQTVVFDPTNNGTATLGGPGINLGTSNKIFNVGSGSADIDMTISAPMTSVGGALTKTGAGVLELTGANTYTGGTTVSAGTLLVNGSLGNGPTVVSSGATLGGNGTIGTVAGVVTNSGTVSPGTSPGTLTINGSYNQTASGTLHMELLSPTSHDKLVVNQFGAGLNGTLNLDLLPGHTLYGNNTLTLIDNTGGTGIINQFATVNQMGFPPLSTASVIYNANAVLLSLFIPQPAGSPANSVAYSAPVLSSAYKNTLNFMNHLGRIRPRFGHKSNDRAVSYQEGSTTEMMAGNDSSMLASNSSQLVASAENSPATLAAWWNPWQSAPQKKPMKKQLAKASDSDTTKVTSPTTSLRVQPSTNRTWGVFADAVGSVGRVYSTSTQDPFRYYSVGGLVGFDYVGDRFGIGFSPGYEYLHGTTLSHQSKFHIQSAEGTVFGTFLPVDGENFFIDLIGGGAYQWYHFERNTVDGKITGSPNGWQGNIYSDIGYTFVRGNGTFTPFVGLGYVHVGVDSYQEKGSVYQKFHIGSTTLNSLRTSLGASGDYSVIRKNFSFIPGAHILWQREFLNHNQKVGFASTPLLISSQMQVYGLGRNTFFAGTLLRFLFNHKVELDASYDYEWNNRFHSHLFLLGLEKRF